MNEYLYKILLTNIKNGNLKISDVKKQEYKERLEQELNL